MFTVEIRINGSLIVHVYGRNISDNPDGTCAYHYELYEPETRKVKSGYVRHARADGITALVAAILIDVKFTEKANKKA